MLFLPCSLFFILCPLYKSFEMIYFTKFWRKSFLFKKNYTVSIRCVTRGGRGGGLPCPFSKIGKKCPNLEKKCPDFGHLWVQFLI